MKKTLFIISAASLLLASCAKEQLVEERSYTGPVTVVSATFESLTEDGTTKASVTDAGAFTWQNGDEAAFAESSSSTSYCSGTNNTDGTTASFEIAGEHSFTASSWAIYPYDLTTDQVPTNLKVKVPASRVWVNEQTNVAMYGKYETASSSFSFSHMGGLVRVRVKNVPTNAREFVFKASGCKINGEFTVETESTYKVINTASSKTESEQTYTLTWTTAPAVENTMDFYIPLPVGEYNGGFAFYLKDESHNTLYSKVGSTPQSIARKKLLLMPAITLVGGSIELAEKAAVVANIPAGYSGDFLLPQSEKVLLKINASTENHNITLKYDGANNIPTNLEVKVVDGDNAGDYNAKLLGNLPYTHVEFTQGNIDHTELTTSSSTLAVINPATVGTLTVKGGNVLLKGATVTSIVVDVNAVASTETKAPVQIVMEKSKSDDATPVNPSVGTITANADVVVAPVSGVEVKVDAAENVQVANEGQGTVKDKNEQAITTKATAKIGDIKYITLADAVKAAPANATTPTTITLLDHVTDGAGIFLAAADKKNIVIDLNTKTYTAKEPAVGSSGTENQAFHLEKDNTVVIKNGTIKCENSNNIFRFVIQNYADLTLEDVTVDGTNLKKEGRTDAYTVSANNGTVTFSGSTTVKASEVSGVDGYALDLYDYTANGYTEPAAGVWNSDGSITGAITLGGGNLTVGQKLTLTKPIKTYKGDKGNVALTVNADIVPADGFTDDALIIVKRGSDVTISGSGKISNNDNTKVYCAVKMTEAADVSSDSESNRAKLTVNGNVTLEGYQAGISGNGNAGRGHTDVTINGSVLVKGCATDKDECCGIYQPQNGTLTINGGTIEGLVGVYVKSGSVTTAVNGGTIKGTGAKNDYVANGGGFKETGDAIVFDNCDYPGGAPNATINGGTFISTNGQAVASYAKDGVQGGPIKPVINGGTFSDLSGVNYVADNGTYKLANDVTLANPLEINSGKTFTIDLNSKTLTGRTNIKHGNVTFKNGNINGGNLQALNVYGSSKSSATNYSVVTVDSDAKVTAEVFGVCLFGPTAGANVGYGAGVNIEGTITTTKTTSSNEGAIFVSGNLGNSQSADIQTAMEGQNFVNISGTVTSASDAALALQGSATATITGTLTGNTGIAAKRGKLIVKENAVITGNGTCVGNPTKNGNGTELTGSAVSASSTYGQRLAIDLQGGTYTSAAYTILNNAVDNACTFSISGGKYESTKSGDGIAVYARLGSVNITGGEFTNNSNSEATLHVGCPSADLSNGPRLTISGDNTVVKNNASGDYTYGGKPLVVNMANQLKYKAVEISGGKFYHRDPSKDDNVSGDNGNFLKSGYSATYDDTNVWTVAASQQN